MAGASWASVYGISRGLLEMEIAERWLRVAIALAPIPFFVSFLWMWMKGLGTMDELERREIRMRNRLKVLRAERDGSQADLAQQLSVSRQTINALETGKYDPILSAAPTKSAAPTRIT